MIDLYILTDYKGYFGSKQKSEWYQSGMDLKRLQSLFKQEGFNPILKCFSSIDFRSESFQGKYVIYTSSEDPGYYYKDYIEDVIYALHYQGARVIPGFEFLRANNNKVFMELLRDLLPHKSIKNIRSLHYGTLEKMVESADKITFPVVIKAAKGAMSKGVYLANDINELKRKTKKISRTSFPFKVLWELKNYIKHKGKIKLSSRFREKFVAQNFVENLNGDWKVLVFGDKYYALERKNRKNDFRASGSGIFMFDEKINNDLLDFASDVFEKFNLPNLSLDIGFNGKEYFLIEFQALYFGTKTLENSPFYFVNDNLNWKIIKGKSDLEVEYVKSISSYIKKL